MNVTVMSPDGAAVVEQTIDHGDGTGTHTVYAPDGAVVSVETISVEVEQFAPLNATGALATLLVVTGALVLADAANAIGEEPAHLVAEAEAWSLAP